MSLFRRFDAYASVAFVAASIFANMAFAQNEPHVQETDPLSPAEQQTKFHLPEGFRIELVASEPLIGKPINLTFDAKGRLLVTTTIDYPFAELEKPGDRLQILEDRDADGSFETQAGEVPGLTIPIGIVPVEKDLVVYGIPNIYRASDPDGDGVYQEKQVLFGPLGYVDTHGMQNGFTRWYDGWVYACHGFRNDSKFVATDGSQIELNSGNTYRFRPDGSRVEVVTRGQVNPFGMAFDQWGNQYTADCHSQPLYQLIPGACYPSFGKPHDGLGFGPTIVEHSHGSTGIGGVAFLDDVSVPEEFRGDAFLCNPITHRVNRDRVVRTGASFRGQEMTDFLTCDDPWFRPVDIKLGPDGCLYVADFYNRIIGHYEVPLDHPGRDRTSGRIWRIRYGEPKNRKQTDFTKLSLDELWQELDSPNATRRLTATHELVDRFGNDAGEAAMERFLVASERQQVAALWIIHRTVGFEGKSGESGESGSLFLPLLTPIVRGHLATATSDRSNEDWDANPGFAEFVIRRLEDEEPMVRRLAAQALARHPKSDHLPALVDCYRTTDPADVYLLHALKIAIRNALQTPGGFDVAATLLPEGAREERKLRFFLIDAALGVQSEEAANFLAEHASADRIGDGQIGAVGEKLGRFLPEGREADLKTWLAGFEGIPPYWPGAMAAVARGAAQRGKPVPEAISTYGLAVCEDKLDSEPNQVSALLDLAIGWNWKLDPKTLGSIVAAEDRPVDVREKACTLMARSQPEAFPLMAGYALSNPDLPPALKKRFVVTLASMQEPSARELVPAALSAMPYSLAHETVREIGYGPDRVKTLVESIQTGKLSESLLREKDVQEGIRQSGVAEAIAFLDERLPKLPPLDQELDKRIADLAARASQSPQPTEQGALVFEQKCAKCHQLAGEGEKIGPQLDGVGHRGALRLLEDILDPNRNVDPAFRSTTFRLSDGQVRNAMIVKEEGQTITVADPEGKLSAIDAGDVEERRTSSLSPMPANWRDALSEDELIELTRFLAAQRPKP